MAIYKPKKKRDYAAEYKRRIASAEAKGRSRQSARGHIAKEHVERARRAKAKFGASPSTLTRLRGKVLAHLIAELEMEGTRKAIKIATLTKGVRLLHVEDLRTALVLNGTDIKAVAAAQMVDMAALALTFPYSEDAVEDAQQNPFWYH